jgi:hypothetical protein
VLAWIENLNFRKSPVDEATSDDFFLWPNPSLGFRLMLVWGVMTWLYLILSGLYFDVEWFCMLNIVEGCIMDWLSGFLGS